MCAPVKQKPRHFVCAVRAARVYLFELELLDWSKATSTGSRPHGCLIPSCVMLFLCFYVFCVLCWAPLFRQQLGPSERGGGAGSDQRGLPARSSQRVAPFLHGDRGEGRRRWWWRYLLSSAFHPHDKKKLGPDFVTISHGVKKY